MNENNRPVSTGIIVEKEEKSEKTSSPSRARAIQRSIVKKFRPTIWRPFVRAVNDYDLISPGDKIAVCISGGKDSMLMAGLFQELKRHGKIPFELVFLSMDPGYNAVNAEKIRQNSEILEIPLETFETRIFDVVDHIPDSPCYLCARMRRGYLYDNAKKLGCNKIALGHHFDDVIETIVMGMLYGGQIQTMMPKLHSTNFEGMELIRPMVLIREKDIIHWAQYNKLSFIRCACRFTEQLEQSGEEADHPSKRQEVKELIAKLAARDPVIENNIFRSVENVNLNTVVAYKKDGVKHHFLDDYDK
ncbi:MAG: tRNA 2-thiocytidine biosynthesis protein TtcA [Eubacteriaceae bacterium]|nr:tRNA 2-thiocytidine biosynthesis protein TtcA [Eubacteriaceae bacterium]